MRKGNKVWFHLTDRQMTDIKPLLDKELEERGMILLQPWQNGEVTGGFIPREQALEIMNVYKKPKKGE